MKRTQIQTLIQGQPRLARGYKTFFLLMGCSTRMSMKKNLTIILKCQQLGPEQMALSAVLSQKIALFVCSLLNTNIS